MSKVDQDEATWNPAAVVSKRVTTPLVAGAKYTNRPSNAPPAKSCARLSAVVVSKTSQELAPPSPIPNAW